MNARVRLQEIDGMIRGANDILARAREETNQLCHAIKCGHATTEDPISDFVLAVFGRHEGVEKKLRAVQERLRGKNGQFLIVTLSEFPASDHPDSPFASNRYADPVSTFAVGYLSSENLALNRRDAQIAFGLNGYIVMKEKEEPDHVEGNLVFMEDSVRSYLAKDLIGVGYGGDVEIAIGDEESRQYFQRIALPHKIALSCALDRLWGNLANRVPEWSSTWLREERIAALKLLEKHTRNRECAASMEIMQRVNAEIRQNLTLLTGIGLGNNPQVVAAKRRLAQDD